MIPVTSARSLPEAFDVLARRTPGLRVQAGGTDFMVAVNARIGLERIGHVLDIWRVPELRGVTWHDGTLRIGALTTYTDLMRSELIRERLPALGMVSREVGAWAIQNRGTIGGNVCNASPAGGTLPLLLAAEPRLLPGRPRHGPLPKPRRRERARAPSRGVVIVLRGGTVLTMDARRSVERADVLVADGRIDRIGRFKTPRGAQVIDCAGRAVIPGLVQAHVHLCQVLFRNHADGLELLDWLSQRIWPFEAAHDARSLGFSARLGIAELLLGGTTAILDMATVRHTEAVLRAAEEGGIRYTRGQGLVGARRRARPPDTA